MYGEDSYPEVDRLVTYWATIRRGKKEGLSHP
jgi:hypothetical protein